MEEKSLGQKILESIKSLEEMLRVLVLEKRLDDLESRIGKISEKKSEENEPLKEEPLDIALNHLEEITTIRKDENGSREFLLHRNTPDLEFEQYAHDNIYETNEETSWIAEIEAAESRQDTKNPVVSIWVPEEAISRIQGAQANTGTWGDLGANPHATGFTIFVKPGSYEIYSEKLQ